MMILRRLANAIMRQDWFVVVLEIVIVIIGIFLGLQVDDWNNARRDRALESQYLQRIYADIQGSIDDQMENDAWDQTRIDTQAVVLEALRATELADENRQAFNQGIHFLGIHNPLRLRWGTVEELKTTGNISVLRSIEIRQHLAALEADFRRMNDLIVDAKKTIQGHRLAVQKRFEAVSYGFMANDEIVLNYDFDALAADQELLNRISHAHESSKFIRTIQQGHHGKLIELRDELAKSLGDTGGETDE